MTKKGGSIPPFLLLTPFFVSRIMMFFIVSTHVLDEQIDETLRDESVPDCMTRPVC